MLYIFDYSNLIKAIFDKGFSSKDVAEILEIPERNYLLKLNNQEEFTQREISILVENVLKLPPESIPEYFFRNVNDNGVRKTVFAPLVTF